VVSKAWPELLTLRVEDPLSEDSCRREICGGGWESRTHSGLKSSAQSHLLHLILDTIVQVLCMRIPAQAAIGRRILYAMAAILIQRGGGFGMRRLGFCFESWRGRADRLCQVREPFVFNVISGLSGGGWR